MLPDRLIPARLVDGRIAPAYLDVTDLPWIRCLLDEMERFSGRAERELDERLSLPLPCSAPPFKLRAAIFELRRLWQPAVDATSDPRSTREALFLAAAQSEGISRTALVDAVARELRITTAALEHAVIADLPGERLVRTPSRALTAEEVVQRVNMEIVRGLVARAQSVSIRADGAIRAIVRQARLSRLLCVVKEDARGQLLEISGPFSLFRHTLLYGRALATLLGRLPYCGHFELSARCVLRGASGSFVLRSDDAALRLTPGPEPREHDSKVEERFARDLRKAAPDWDIVKEPEVRRVGSMLFFPDFVIVNRLDPNQRFLVEIVGFWTREYLEKKLLKLRETRDIIVCADETLACDEGDFPTALDVIWYKRRIDVASVLRAIDARQATKSRARRSLI